MTLNIIDIPKWGQLLRGQWRACFAGHLSPAKQKAIGLDGFLWHLCSYEQTECFEKEAALAAFRKQPKKKCTIFYQFIDEAYLVEQADALRVEALPYDKSHMYYGDLYVMDWAQNWTFILTHSECGPYFIRKKVGFDAME